MGGQQRVHFRFQHLDPAIQFSRQDNALEVRIEPAHFAFQFTDAAGQVRGGLRVQNAAQRDSEREPQQLFYHRVRIRDSLYESFIVYYS